MKKRVMLCVTSLSRLSIISMLAAALFLGVFAGTSSALTCGDCHDNPPVDNPTRDGSTGRFPGSHNKHAGTANLNLPCTVCHVNNGSNTAHRNAYIDMATPINGDSGASYTKGASFPQSNAAFSGGTCNSVYCHSTVQGINGTGAGTDKPQTWGAAGLSCSDCHADMSGASATGKHVKHTNSTAGNYNMPCSNCHTGYAFNLANNAIHANKTINVTLATGTYSGGSTPGDHTPGGGYGSCSSVYCHSNGNPSGGINSYSTISWGGTVGCGSCHKTTNTAANMQAAGTPSPMSAPHVQHMATDRYGQNSNFSCNTCHSATASDSSTISTPGEHTDSQKDVVFNAWVVSGGTATWSSNQCSNTYCHSTGQSVTPTHTGISWSGSMDGECDSCHGGNPSSTVTTGKGPIVTNAHGAHTNDTANKVGFNTGCAECHSATVTADRSLSSMVYHVNKSLNVRFDNGTRNKNADTPTYNSMSAQSTVPGGATANPGAQAVCSNVYCHSSGNLSAPTGGSIVVSGSTPTYKSPAWNSAALACDGCHGDQAGRSHPTYTSGAAGSTTANSHVKHVENGNNYTCDYCHSTTTVSQVLTVNTMTVIPAGAHLDRVETVSMKSIDGKTGTYDPTVGTGKTCSATYCHGTGASPQWGGTTTCATCHEASNTGLSTRHDRHYNTATLPTAINATNANTATAYVYGCGNCHPGGTHAQGPASTVQAAQVLTGGKISVYGPAGTNLTDGKGYKYTNYGTCTTVCHTRDGVGAAPVVTATWGGAYTGACNVCHRAAGEIYTTMTTTTTRLSDKHAMHMASDRYGANSNFTCNTCHSGTAMDNSTINGASGRNQHPDTAKNVAFNAWVVSGGTGTWNGTQCSNTYCHSNGTVFTGSLTHTGLAWTAGSLSCNGCHNSPPSGYATKANAHAKHSSYTCNECHGTVVDATPSIIDRALHVNKAYNIFSAKVTTYIPEAAPSATGGTCNTITCHGNNNAAWGATLVCSDCHGNSGASGTEVEDYGTGTAASIANGTTANINVIDWNAVGHGKDSGSYASTNPAANLLQNWAGGNKCLFCHDSLVSHNTATNPFRLRNVATVNKVCMDCHDSNVGNRPGVQPTGATAPKTGTKFVGANHYNLGAASNARHNATDLSGGRFCWDCHDAHGTAGNNYMIGLGPNKRLTRRVDTTNFDLGIPFGGTNSIGNTKAFGRTNSVTFTAVKSAETRTHYVTEAAYDSSKVCQTCHDSTSGIAQYANGLSTNGHNAPTLCSQCHKHDTSGFQGLADDCGNCHTTANLSAQHASHSDPDGFLAGKKLSQSDYGRITAGGGGIWWYNVSYVSGAPKYACGYCHPQASATHNNGTKNLNFSPSDTGAAGTVKAKNNATQTFTQTPGVTVTCSSVYCHSNGLASGYTYTTTPDWYGSGFPAGDDRCGKCHGNYPSDTGQAPGSSAHAAHAVGIHYDDIYTGTSGVATAGTGATNGHGNATYSTTINCNICHYSTVTMARNKLGSLCKTCHTGDVAGNTMVIATTGATHVNGSPDVSFQNLQVKSRAQIRDDITTIAELNNNWSRPASSYKTGATPYDTAKNALNTGTMWDSGAKSCSNIACHNGNSATWNSTISCNACHTALP